MAEKRTSVLCPVDGRSQALRSLLSVALSSCEHLVSTRDPF